MIEECQVETNRTKIEKKTFKKEVNKLLRTLIGYEVMMFLVPFAYMLIFVFQNMSFTEEQVDAFATEAMKNGVILIIGVAIGMIFIVLYRKKELFTYDLKTVHHKMNLKCFLKILICFMAVQVVFSVGGFLTENLLNHFGYTILGEIESAGANSTTVSMLLYVSFLGPIAEEIVFRGAVLRKLEERGKLFAIVVSAILFGVFHGNLIQGIFAIVVGLILGYVALEYSIKWSILLHIINNFIFGDVLGYITEHINPVWGEIINNGILGLFFVGGAIILIKNRSTIKKYIEENRTEKSLYRYTFSSAWMIVFLAINLLMAIAGIEKIAS